jgi:uncharacterized membrane protein
MAFLVIGMILFLATHSLRVFAAEWRQRQIDRIGEKRWKGIMSALAAAALVFLIWGFGQARADAVTLYQPPLWLKHAAAALVLVAFVLIAAAYVPGNSFKARFGHPMVLGTKVWAFAHLLANGRDADLVLFGGFLLWSAIDYASSRKRDRLAGVTQIPATLRGNIVVISSGIAAWALFAFLLHGWLIGVSPLT